jgi:hypothetical protein
MKVVVSAGVENMYVGCIEVNVAIVVDAGIPLIPTIDAESKAIVS